MAKRLTISSSIADSRPDLMRYWDEDRNTKDPHVVLTSSRASVHWVCPDNPTHRWMAIVANMAADCKCPGCVAGADRTRPSRPPKVPLSEACPDVANEWYTEYNGDITPDDVGKWARYRYWWMCSEHGVAWEAAVSDRAAGKGCPLCRGSKISEKRSTIKPGDSLADKYPELTSEWDILRNTTTPDKVFAHGRDIVHWVCPNMECRNRYTTAVYNRTCNGSGCPVCSARVIAEKVRIPRPGHSLLDVFPLIADEFVCDEYGNTDPGNVAYSSGTICTWKCSVCGETVWQASVNNRTAKKEDLPGCKLCSAKRVGLKNRRPRNGIYLVDGAKDIANEWDTDRNRDELGLSVDEMALGSNIEVYWICPYCGESYLMSINKRTSRGDGHSGCASRKRYSFPEKAVLYYVQRVFPDAIGNARPQEIEGLGQKELDVWIPSRRIAIEYDGQGWHTDPKSELDKDAICANNGVVLIRIRETKCVTVYRESVFTSIIDRNPDGGFKTLDEAIEKLLLRLGKHADVNTMRDEGAIRREMHLAFVKGSLAETYKDVASQWDYDGNGDLTPWMFKPHSDKVVSWVCPNGHGTYMQKITDRTKRGDVCSCEACVHERRTSLKKPKPGQSFGDLFPSMVDDWVDDLNCGVTPYDVGTCSRFVAYWHCPNHPEPYSMSVASRARGCGCPFCSTPAKRVLPGFNDLATKHPELVGEWDDDENGDVTPRSVLCGSHYMAHWICSDPDCGARWVAEVSSRSMGRGCPKCKVKRISEARMRAEKGRSLEDLHRGIAKCWSMDDNGGRSPSEIRPLSKKEYVWLCQRCGDKFVEKVSTLTKAGRVLCKECRKIVGHSSRGMPKPKPGRSLGDVDIVLDEFLPRDKNGGLTAHDLSMTSKMSIDWKCPRCGEEWTTSPDLMRKRKRKCKKCGYGSSS